MNIRQVIDTHFLYVFRHMHPCLFKSRKWLNFNASDSEIKKLEVLNSFPSTYYVVSNGLHLQITWITWEARWPIQMACSFNWKLRNEINWSKIINGMLDDSFGFQCRNLPACENNLLQYDGAPYWGPQIRTSPCSISNALNCSPHGP